MGERRRRCTHCKTKTASLVRVTAHLVYGVVPSGKTLQYRCKTCLRSFDLMSATRILLLLATLGAIGAACAHITWDFEHDQGFEGLFLVALMLGVGALVGLDFSRRLVHRH